MKEEKAMKLIVCDLCHDVVQLKYDLRSCACENIKGKYIDKINIEIHVKNKMKCRILGLGNDVRHGDQHSGSCWIIKFTDQTVKKLVKIKIGGKSDENK